MTPKKKNLRSKAGQPAHDPFQASPWLPWAGYWIILFAALFWVGAHAWMVDQVTVRLCAQQDASLDIPQGQRLPLFLSEIAFDGYVWNRHAEKLGENGEWRARHTDMDNYPKGREIHWNSAFAWYLRGLGEIHRAVTGDNLKNSIYRMSIWANPILLALAIGIFSSLSARRFGPLCGSVMAVGMVAVPTFYEGFMPAYPDHHGIISFALMGLLFGIAWAGGGWVQPTAGLDFAPPRCIRQARWGMVFSGICGAIGLWLSAFATAVVAFGIGLGAMLSVATVSRRKAGASEAVYHAELWRLWGLTTALAGFLLYLFEYFPHHMAMRLEVIHPLYLAAWLAGGWAIAATTGWLAGPKLRLADLPWKTLLICALVCALLPALILGGGQRFYKLLEPFQLKISSNIAETLPLLTRIRMGGLTWQMAFGWFPILLVAAFAMQGVRAVGRGTRAVLLFLCLPILVVTALQFHQTRWGLLAGPLYIALAGIAIPQLWKLVPKDNFSRVIASVMLLALTVLFVQPSLRNAFSIASTQYFAKGPITLTAGQALALVHRKMAYAIRQDAGDHEVVVLSSPNSSCLLAGLGGFKTIGTLYWENVEGMKAAARALNAQSDQDALDQFQKLGVTHVALMTWENFIEPYFRILHPKPGPEQNFENSFGKKALFDKTIPPWTRPLAFPPDDLIKALKQDILILSVHPEQTPSEAQYHLARFVRRVEDNPVSAEVILSSLVEKDPNFALAKAELGDLLLSQNRTAEAMPLLSASISGLDARQRETLSSHIVTTLTEKKEWKARAEWLRSTGASPDATPAMQLNAAWGLVTAPGERDTAAARNLLTQAESGPSTPVERSLIQAAILAAEGKYEEARAALREPLESKEEKLNARAREMDKAYSEDRLWIETPAVQREN